MGSSGVHRTPRACTPPCLPSFWHSRCSQPRVVARLSCCALAHTSPHALSLACGSRHRPRPVCSPNCSASYGRRANSVVSCGWLALSPSAPTLPPRPTHTHGESGQARLPRTEHGMASGACYRQPTLLLNPVHRSVHLGRARRTVRSAMRASRTLGHPLPVTHARRQAGGPVSMRSAARATWSSRTAKTISALCVAPRALSTCNPDPLGALGAGRRAAPACSGPLYCGQRVCWTRASASRAAPAVWCLLCMGWDLVVWFQASPTKKNRFAIPALRRATHTMPMHRSASHAHTGARELGSTLDRGVPPTSPLDSRGPRVAERATLGCGARRRAGKNRRPRATTGGEWGCWHAAARARTHRVLVVGCHRLPPTRRPRALRRAAAVLVAGSFSSPVRVTRAAGSATRCRAASVSRRATHTCHG